jgi:serine/threonine protein kinase
MSARNYIKGVNHLHELGLIHNDLKPLNIMIDGDNPILIDFDSCKRVGEKLGVKAGTICKTIASAEYATPKNDLFSISKLQEFLRVE